MANVYRDLLGPSLVLRATMQNEQLEDALASYLRLESVAEH